MRQTKIDKTNNEMNQDEKNMDAIPEIKKIDPHFYKLFMKNRKQMQTPPEVGKKLVELAYAEEKKFLAKKNLNNSDWLSWLKSMVYRITQLELSRFFRIAIPVAIAVFIVGISIAMLYSFTGNKNTSLIANNPTPISTSKLVTNTPSPTPSIAKEVTPKNQKDNKGNIENINPDNDTNVAKKQKLENKLKENINTLYKKENNKTDHIKDHTKDTIKDEDLISKTYPINITIPTTRTIELINNNMVYIGSFSEDDFDETKKKWLEELHNCLVKEIPSVKSDLEWEVVSAENATISLQIDDKNESVVIVNSKAEDIWRMKITDYIKDSPRVVADRIIEQLQKDITIFSQK